MMNNMINFIYYIFNGNKTARLHERADALWDNVRREVKENGEAVDQLLTELTSSKRREGGNGNDT